MKPRRILIKTTQGTFTILAKDEEKLVDIIEIKVP
jgi:hypothetical protein